MVTTAWTRIASTVIEARSRGAVTSKDTNDALREWLMPMNERQARRAVDRLRAIYLVAVAVAATEEGTRDEA